MIIDKLENIVKYGSIIPESVIEFLIHLSPEAVAGHNKIKDEMYANIDIYPPKPYENCKFEAHKKYIDIQMILSGEEDLEYTSAAGLEVIEKYNDEKDIMFLKSPKFKTDKVHLTPYKFALIFPHEAHKPQIKTTTGLVKKVVVKIPV